jgi:TPR repeat protein
MKESTIIPDPPVTDDDLFEQTLGLMKEADDARRNTDKSLVEAKAWILAGAGKIDEVIRAHLTEDKIVGGLRHSIADRVAKSRTAKIISDAARVVPVLVVALIMGASPSGRIEPMAKKTDPPIVKARGCLKNLDWKNAEKYYSAAVVPGDPIEAECLFRIGECRMNLMNFNGAIRACEELEVASPESVPRAYLLRGLIHQAMGDVPAARGWFTKSSELGNKDASILLTLVK